MKGGGYFISVKQLSARSPALGMAVTAPAELGAAAHGYRTSDQGKNDLNLDKVVVSHGVVFFFCLGL